LNYLGRYAANGDNTVVPDLANTQMILDYGDLSTEFPTFVSQNGLANPDLYKATVTRIGTISLSSASASQYNIEVCWKDKASELCISAITLGPDSPGRSALAN
jgi:hypothetical protein